MSRNPLIDLADWLDQRLNAKADVDIRTGTVVSLAPLVVELAGEDPGEMQQLGAASVNDVGLVLCVGSRRVWLGPELS